MTGPPTTATTQGAREHARSQAGTVTDAMPTIPASGATDLPAGAAMLARRLRDPKWLAEAGALAARLGRERYSADIAAKRLAEVLQRAAARS